MQKSECSLSKSKKNDNSGPSHDLLKSVCACRRKECKALKKNKERRVELKVDRDVEVEREERERALRINYKRRYAGTCQAILSAVSR
jgi:hypothetical protein